MVKAYEKVNKTVSFQQVTTNETEFTKLIPAGRSFIERNAYTPPPPAFDVADLDAKQASIPEKSYALEGAYY